LSEESSDERQRTCLGLHGPSGRRGVHLRRHAGPAAPAGLGDPHRHHDARRLRLRGARARGNQPDSPGRGGQRGGRAGRHPPLPGMPRRLHRLRPRDHGQGRGSAAQGPPQDRLRPRPERLPDRPRGLQRDRAQRHVLRGRAEPEDRALWAVPAGPLSLLRRSGGVEGHVRQAGRADDPGRRQRRHRNQIAHARLSCQPARLAVETARDGRVYSRHDGHGPGAGRAHRSELCRGVPAAPRPRLPAGQPPGWAGWCTRARTQSHE